MYTPELICFFYIGSCRSKRLLVWRVEEWRL